MDIDERQTKDPFIDRVVAVSSRVSLVVEIYMLVTLCLLECQDTGISIPDVIFFHFSGFFLLQKVTSVGFFTQKVTSVPFYTQKVTSVVFFASVD
mgnify:CR=1 FL=1